MVLARRVPRISGDGPDAEPIRSEDAETSSRYVPIGKGPGDAGRHAHPGRRKLYFQEYIIRRSMPPAAVSHPCRLGRAAAPESPGPLAIIAGS